jgi:hypothetical protein
LQVSEKKAGMRVSLTAAARFDAKSTAAGRRKNGAGTGLAFF